MGRSGEAGATMPRRGADESRASLISILPNTRPAPAKSPAAGGRACARTGAGMPAGWRVACRPGVETDWLPPPPPPPSPLPLPPPRRCRRTPLESAGAFILGPAVSRNIQTPGAQTHGFHDAPARTAFKTRCLRWRRRWRRTPDTTAARRRRRQEQRSTPKSHEGTNFVRGEYDNGPELSDRTPASTYQN